MSDSERATGPVDLWQQWLDATTKTWEQAVGRGSDLLELPGEWMKTFEETWAKAPRADELPSDPLTFALQWCRAAGEAWSRSLGELEEMGASGEPGDTAGPGPDGAAVRRLAQGYAQGYAALAALARYTAEEYARLLQLPTHADVERVGERVRALEEALSRITEIVAAQPRPATAAALEGLAQHLDRFERTVVGVERGVAALASSATMDQVDRRLDQVERTVVGVEGHVATLASAATAEGVERRLDQVERLIVGVERGLEVLASATTLGPVEQRLGQVERGLEVLVAATTLEPVERRLEQVERVVGTLASAASADGRESLEGLEGLEKRLGDVEQKLDRCLSALEQLDATKMAASGEAGGSGRKAGAKRGSATEHE